jgi:hypothetical protein
MEAVSSRAVFSASVPELIYFLGDIKLEAKFWIRSQSEFKWSREFLSCNMMQYVE